jgi:hypothetical protein
LGMGEMKTACLRGDKWLTCHKIICIYMDVYYVCVYIYIYIYIYINLQYSKPITIT